MEMEAVANIFDRDGDGFIDYKEFVSALRPNRDVSHITPIVDVYNLYQAYERIKIWILNMTFCIVKDNY